MIMMILSPFQQSQLAISKLNIYWLIIMLCMLIIHYIQNRLGILFTSQKDVYWLDLTILLVIAHVSNSCHVHHWSHFLLPKLHTNLRSGFTYHYSLQRIVINMWSNPEPSEKHLSSVTTYTTHLVFLTVKPCSAHLTWLHSFKYATLTV